MEKLTSLLLTSQPKVIKYTPNFLQGIDPVLWAANLCRKNALNGLRLQAKKSLFGAEFEDNVMVSCDPAHQDTMNGIVDHISNGTAGHANLELGHIDCIARTSIFSGATKLYDNVFKDALNTAHPLGHYVKMILWFSASKHLYGAHSDLADGFLFQIAGKKHVKVWPLPDNCRDEVIYDHSDLAIRQSLPYKEFALQPGDVLFLPGGAAHEVTVDDGFSSVSLSYHLGCPYPLLVLLSDLKRSNAENNFTVADGDCLTQKFVIKFFNPGRHVNINETNVAHMLASLRDKLCSIIQTDCSDAEFIKILDVWWENKLKKPTYAGPYEFN